MEFDIGYSKDWDGFIVLSVGFSIMLVLHATGNLVGSFSVGALFLLGMFGLFSGIFSSLGFEEAGSNILAGVILLLAPLIVLISFGGMSSGSIIGVIEGAAEALSWTAFLFGMVIGIHSTTWILQGYRKLKSGTEGKSGSGL